MSSILDALKKLEKDHGSPREGLPLSKNSETQISIQERLTEIWYSNRVVIICTALVLFAMSAWFVLIPRPILSERSSTDSVVLIPDLNKREVVNTPASRNSQAEPLSAIPFSEESRKRESEPRITGSEKTDHASPDAKPLKLKQEAHSFQALKSVAKSLEDDVSRNAVESRSNETGAGIPSVQSIQMELVDEAVLKLQAISWSSDPKKRIAVINNKILREGETVDSFYITRIGEDDVHLKSGGKLWKLAFQLK